MRYNKTTGLLSIVMAGETVKYVASQRQATTVFCRQLQGGFADAMRAIDELKLQKA